MSIQMLTFARDFKMVLPAGKGNVQFFHFIVQLFSGMTHL